MDQELNYVIVDVWSLILNRSKLNWILISSASPLISSVILHTRTRKLKSLKLPDRYFKIVHDIYLICD